MDRPHASRRSLLLAALGAPLLLHARGLFAASCAATPAADLGAGYRPDAPARKVLCAAAEPGRRLVLSGTVSSADACRRLRDAVLDVWQADAAGNYDMESASFRLRGRVQPDALGRYRFESRVPGYVGDRARHINFRVGCPGYETLVTACWFHGDPRLASDPDAKPELTVQLHRGEDAPADAPLYGELDFVLQPRTAAPADTPQGPPPAETPAVEPRA